MPEKPINPLNHIYRRLKPNSRSPGISTSG